MAQSIGDLFVKLGFDVDDSKLRSFDESLKSVFSNVLKFAGVTASGAGAYELAKGVAETTNAWRNFSTEVGGSTEELQKFIALYKTVNPFASTAQAGQVATNIQQYGSNLHWGIGGSEYGMFGGSAADFINPATGQYDAARVLPAILSRLQSGRAQAMANVGGDQAQFNKLVTAITGSSDTVNILNATAEQQEKAKTALDLTKQSIDDANAAAQAISQLTISWDNFINHAIASLAPAATGLIDTVEKKGFWAGISYIGEHSYLPGLVDWAGKNSFLPSVHTLGAAIQQGAKGNIFKDQNELDIGKQMRALGWDDAHISAALTRLKIESGFNPAAVGDGGQAYGLAQWHPDRQAEFARIMGHDIRRSTLAEQVQFMNYELTKGHERAAGDKFFGAKDARSAYDSFTKDYERPATTTNNVTIEVISNSADPEEVAQRVHQRFIDITYPTKNLGGF